MRQRVLSTVAAMVVAMPAVLTVGVGTAVPRGNFHVVRPDFPAVRFQRQDVHRANRIRPPALVRSTGSELIADVQIATAIPNTPYDVRLIQTPRSSASS